MVCGVHWAPAVIALSASHVWNAEVPDWDVDNDNVGERTIGHRHGVVRVAAMVHVDREKAWAECSMCQAQLGVALRGLGRSDSAPRGLTGPGGARSEHKEAARLLDALYESIRHEVA